MAKKYEIPEEEPQMVCDSAVAYSYVNEKTNDSVTEWDEPNAPCMFSSEELHSVIIQSLDDKNNGRVHSHADVQRMINSRIEAWR